MLLSRQMGVMRDCRLWLRSNSSYLSFMNKSTLFKWRFNIFLSLLLGLCVSITTCVGFSMAGFKSSIERQVDFSITEMKSFGRLRVIYLPNRNLNYLRWSDYYGFPLYGMQVDSDQRQLLSISSRTGSPVVYNNILYLKTPKLAGVFEPYRLKTLHLFGYTWQLLINILFFAILFYPLTYLKYYGISWLRTQRSQCLRCGYRVVDAERCPECGYVVTRRPGT